ncbi:MAG: GHKL domain-containing protein [Clostridia bacterium]|nr:GHKL domain-containing protein [Clostridia bacterium]
MLRAFSLLWSMVHTLVLFLMLFESRYPKKKMRAITFSTMIPLIAVNTVLTFLVDADTMGVLMLLTLSLPSLIVFWFLAKNRDGRFFFTFCLVDTVVLEIIYITAIIDFYVTPDTNILMFATRLVIYPILEWLIYKKIRPIFLGVQNQVKRGWYVFAVIGALFYVLMTLVINRPTIITSRPEYLPAAILLFILIPVIYIHIFVTLIAQQKFHDVAEQENILKLQVHNTSARIEELAAADEKFREERHNLRHKMKIITNLVETGQYDELRKLMVQYNDNLRETQVKRYCKNAVIDAVLSTFIKSAESKGITVNVGVAFPEPIPINETELATVFANAIENAIHACEKLENGQPRVIDIKVLSTPQFMVQISNTYNGQVEFDDNGIPVNREHDHGFGTRSIAAFCNKYGAYYQFQATADKFTLYLNL